MKEQMDLRIEKWAGDTCTIEWPKEASYGSVLIAKSGRSMRAYLVADSKPIAGYDLSVDDVAKFHAAAAEHWYRHERNGSYSVLSGSTHKGGAVRPLPPLPPFPVGQPAGLLALTAQLSHAATDQFESIAACLVSSRHDV